MAQASISHWRDLAKKAAKALETDGPSFINVLSPCHRGWRYPIEQTVEIARLAVQSCVWPLYEVEQGEWQLNQKVRKKKPIEEYIKPQGRFAHLMKEAREAERAKLQEFVDQEWERLLKWCGEA